MRTLLFLVGLGGGYAIAQALGASEGWSAAAGWAGAIAIFLIGRRRSYAAGNRVERYRAAAQMLRVQDPDTYWQIVAQADGSEAEGAARRDPDAYVALFMAAAQDAGVSAPEAFRAPSTPLEPAE